MSSLLTNRHCDICFEKKKTAAPFLVIPFQSLLIYVLHNIVSIFNRLIKNKDRKSGGCKPITGGLCKLYVVYLQLRTEHYFYILTCTDPLPIICLPHPIPLPDPRPSMKGSMQTFGLLQNSPCRHHFFQ